jgi:fructose-1,6-bisphosphatase/inositol monophosphatase family enzyme
MHKVHTQIAQHLSELARRAGAAVQALQGHVRISHKGPADRVTEADEVSHRIITSGLTELYPGVQQVMEEQANLEPVPRDCIVVDELDGTNLYSCGGEEYAIALAWLERGLPMVGVMHQPARQETIVAIRGSGAFRNAERIHLDQNAELADSFLLFELNRFVELRGRHHLLNLTDHTLGVRSLGTAIGSAMEVLRGRAAVYINWRGAKIWDFAAAALAIEEAGGLAQTCTGSALSWERIPMSVMLAANRAIAAAAVSRIPD